LKCFNLITDGDALAFRDYFIFDSNSNIDFKNYSLKSPSRLILGSTGRGNLFFENCTGDFLFKFICWTI